VAKEKAAAEFRPGYVKATVWKNGDFYSTVLSRSYEDGENWKDTDQLANGDLMNAVRVLQRAEDYIISSAEPALHLCRVSAACSLANKASISDSQ